MSNEGTIQQGTTNEPADEASDRIFTIPNLISFVRLCLVPVYIYLMFNGYDIVAAILFAVAASTDFVDGQIARRTHSVSKLGQLLDPFVDRVLMITAVIVLMLLGRLPVWIVALVLARDVLLLIGGAYLLRAYKVRVPVIYPGKVATTFLFVGFAGLMLNVPLIKGLGVVSVGWLPGFNAAFCSWGIWFIYIGMVIGVFTTIYYVVAGIKAMNAVKKAAV